MVDAPSHHRFQSEIIGLYNDLKMIWGYPYDLGILGNLN